MAEERPSAGQDLRARNQELEAQVRELRDTINAIRGGEVDAIVVSDGGGTLVYTLEGPDAPYRALVESISEGALTLSPDGLILYANARFASMLGLPPDKIPGTSIFDHLDPEGLPAFQATFGKLPGAPCRGRTRLRLVRGSIPVNLSMSPVSGEPGSQISVIVTDRSEDEMQIRFQSRILDSVGDAVMVTDTDDRVLYWNAAATVTYGWGQDEAIGRPLTDIASPGAGREAGTYIPRELDAGGTFTGEYQVKHRDGHLFPIQMHMAPILNETGVRIATLCISRDITEGKEAEEKIRRHVGQLQETNAELEQFNRLMVEREIRMVELKREVNELSRLLGKPPRYPVD